MNKLLLAVLFLAISGKCAAESLEKEVEQEINAARAKLTQEFQIYGISGMQWSDKLAKEAKESGDRCGSIGVTTGGNRVKVVFTLRTLELETRHSDSDFFYAIAKKFLNDPGLTEIGFYMTKTGDADTKCKRREQHWVVVAAPFDGKVKDLTRVPERERGAVDADPPAEIPEQPEERSEEQPKQHQKQEHKATVRIPSPSAPSPPGPNTPGSSPDATTSSAMSSPVVFLAIALVFFGF